MLLHACGAVVMNCEGDIAAYTVAALGDGRVLNRQLHVRPPLNLLSQHDMAHIWEDKVRQMEALSMCSVSREPVHSAHSSLRSVVTDAVH